MAGVEPLGRNRDFRVVLVIGAISALGDALTSVALPLLVLALTGSGVALGVVGAIGALADFLVAMPAGVVADRGDRKRLMVRADLGRAMLTALVPVSVLAGGPTLAVILVVAAPLSVLRAMFRAGSIAAIPDLVGRPQLARANAVLETAASTAFIVGPSIAGLLAVTIGPGPTLAIDALTFAISAGGLLLVRRELRAPADRPRAGMAVEIRDGIAYVGRHPVLRAAIVLFSLYTGVTAGLVAALAFRITRDLAQPSTVLGLVLAGWSVGTLAGSVAVPWVVARAGVARILVGGVAATGFSLLGMAAVGGVVATVGLAVAFGAAEGLVSVTYVTVRTAYSPDELLGRIGSSARSVSLGLQPVGFLAAGVLIDAIGGTLTIAVMGGTLCLLAAAFALVRSLRLAVIQPPPPG